MTDNTLPAAIAARRTVIMRRKLLLPAVGVIAACVAAGFWWNSTRWQVSTDDAYARADIVTLAPKSPAISLASKLVTISTSQPGNLW